MTIQGVLPKKGKKKQYYKYVYITNADNLNRIKINTKIIPTLSIFNFL